MAQILNWQAVNLIFCCHSQGFPMDILIWMKGCPTLQQSWARKVDQNLSGPRFSQPLNLLKNMKNSSKNTGDLAIENKRDYFGVKRI